MTQATHPRREFLKQAGAMALATSATAALQTSPVLAANALQKTAESLVTVLYESLTDKQKKEVCFDWDFVEKKRGLLRTRLENNWKITKPSIKSNFYTKEQQHLAQQARYTATTVQIVRGDSGCVVAPRPCVCRVLRAVRPALCACVNTALRLNTAQGVHTALWRAVRVAHQRH